ncbi:MAG: hypothetical protein WCX32_00550 [Clostridia bacterium]|jgi:stage III sporulation protein AG|nr:hypothetical protein [Clostridia bacterium]MDD4275415.1 hypothetical protein [Clostridia bacterium]
MDSNVKPKKTNILDLPIFKKLKSVKNIELIIAVVLCAIVLLIFFSTFSTSDSSSADTTNTVYTSTSEYVNELETKLSNILANINGAGKVSVMITTTGSSQLVIATSTEERNNSTSTTQSGSTINTNTSVTIIETPILVTDQGTSSPLILQEIQPEIKGVIVVAEGADNIKVKLEILKAVSAILGISTQKIEIFTGK